MNTTNNISAVSSSVFERKVSQTEMN